MHYQKICHENVMKISCLITLNVKFFENFMKFLITIHGVTKNIKFMVFSNDFEGIFHASDSMKMPLREFLSMFNVNVRESPIKT